MTGDANAVLSTINYAVDAVFACDMLLQFFVGFWDPSLKAMCYDPVVIARRYASSWLPMDVVSIFPFDVRLIDRSIDRARATRGEQEGRGWVDRTRVTNSQSTPPRTHTRRAIGDVVPVRGGRARQRAAAHAARRAHRAAHQARAALAARADGGHARDQVAVHRADEVRAADDLPDALGDHLSRAARSSCEWLDGGYALE